MQNENSVNRDRSSQQDRHKPLTVRAAQSQHSAWSVATSLLEHQATKMLSIIELQQSYAPLSCGLRYNCKGILLKEAVGLRPEQQCAINTKLPASTEWSVCVHTACNRQTCLKPL